MKFIKWSLYCAATIGSAVFGGYVFSTLWGWFIAGKFGLPQIGIAEAVGIYYTVGFLTTQYSDMKAAEGVAKGEILMHHFVKSLTFLGLGWIVLQFI